jgi:hypothetical protein
MKNLKKIVSDWSLKTDPLLWLGLATFFVFMGRSWQHLAWDSPLRTVFWDENLLSPYFGPVFQMTWNEYVTQGNSDHWIQMCIRGMGALFALSALAVTFLFFRYKMTSKKSSSSVLSKTALFLGGALLVGLSLLYWKEKFYQHAQFLEYASQFGAPFLFLWALRSKSKLGLLYCLRACVALTFICHGLYALGYYPVPGDFQDMTMNLLGIGNAEALALLKLAGIIDVLAGGGLFFRSTEKISIIYCVMWGFATAVARVAANLTSQNWLQDLAQWLPETLYRLPHGFIPLALLSLLFQLGRSLIPTEDPKPAKTYHTSLGTHDHQLS